MKSSAIIIVLLALATLMVYTNPSSDDLGNYVRQYVMKESQKKMQEPSGQFLSSILGGIAGSVISSQTLRTDYILFSTYEVQFGKERFKALGIFKNFILLEKPDLERLKRGNRPAVDGGNVGGKRQ
ncbi:MAG: DUF4359 domain-containing protein [Syntrophobacteraceae bacterium]|jgi:hypothetical protein